MIKPASLRAALVAAIPALAESPEKLTVFIDQGALAATGTISSSFEYRYVLNVIVLDFAGDADDLFIALVDWVRMYQSDLVSNFDQRSNGITFEIDILDNATADVSIKLQMTESVVVGTGPTGERTVTHIDDSQALADSITWTGEPWPKS